MNYTFIKQKNGHYTNIKHDTHKLHTKDKTQITKHNILRKMTNWCQHTHTKQNKTQNTKTF